MMKAFLIDPFNREITEVETDGSLESIYALLQVQMIEVVYMDNEDCIYVDEEGLLGNLLEQAWFAIPDFKEEPLAGRGLVLGTDNKGANVSPIVSLEEMRGRVVWCRLDVIQRRVIPVR
jgi:hypothetical protein